MKANSNTQGGDIRIRMKQNVRPELIIFAKPGTVLKAGMIYQAISNRRGAISGLCDNGEYPGVRPGEFEFVEAPEWVLKIWSKHEEESQ
ncbi:hypothetical protein [Anaerobacterium chartisolvens]|nr:hypothetical protein [Anaerobacterium chartisolvens]